MARPEAAKPQPHDVDAYSVSTFCKRNGFSPQFFYKFKTDMPPTIRIGGRVLISVEAAAQWRRDRATAETA